MRNLLLPVAELNLISGYTDVLCSTFEVIADYCDSHCSMIPVGFVLAFYVSMVVDRFWRQFEQLPWTMRLGTHKGHIHIKVTKTAGKRKKKHS